MNAMREYMGRSKLVMDTILRRPADGIPAGFLNIMEHALLDRLARAPAGTYVKNPVETYLALQRNMGAGMLDQFIPDNPLSMGSHGYEARLNTATTGAEEIVLDGVRIDSPEAVAEHLERFVFPRLREQIAAFDEQAVMRGVMERELEIQKTLGDSILKTGYGFVRFPGLAYCEYGYENYFMFYALYPEAAEKHFSLQADLALLNNTAVAKLYAQKLLPPLYRLDHDMADSRGTLASPESLDELWLPHFTRCLEPLLETDVNLIWHCDGNLMEMLPRLIAAGVKGFQGFQYEDGMDYQKICRMKTRDGDSLIIWAGASVTRTLPMGTPQDVWNELKFLVENGPQTGLFLGASSSVAPGVPWENMQALQEGLAYYRTYRR